MQNISNWLISDVVVPCILRVNIPLSFIYHRCEIFFHVRILNKCPHVYSKNTLYGIIDIPLYTLNVPSERRIHLVTYNTSSAPLCSATHACNVYAHTHAHRHTRIHTHTFTHLRTYNHTRACVYHRYFEFMKTTQRVCIIYKHVRVYVCRYVYVCTSID